MARKVASAKFLDWKKPSCDMVQTPGQCDDFQTQLSTACFHIHSGEFLGLDMRRMSEKA